MTNNNSNTEEFYLVYHIPIYGLNTGINRIVAGTLGLNGLRNTIPMVKLPRNKLNVFNFKPISAQFFISIPLENNIWGYRNGTLAEDGL